MYAENVIQGIGTVITVPIHELLVRHVSGGALSVQSWRLLGGTQIYKLGTNGIPSVFPTGKPRTFLNRRFFFPAQ